MTLRVKKHRRRKKNPRFYAVGARALRATLWLTQSEIDWLRERAKKVLPLTPRGRPRTGIIVSEIVRLFMEEDAKR